MISFPSTRRAHTCTVTALVFAFAAIAAGFSASAAAQSPIRCASVTSGTDRATVDIDPFKPVSFQYRTLINNNAQWVTPNMAVASESTSFLYVMCFGTDVSQQVMLQVRPSQEYLDELKALNLDVRVFSRYLVQSSEIMLLRDRVSSTTGRMVPLDNVRSVSWNYTGATRYYNFKSGETRNNVAPQVTLWLEYVVADVSKPARGKLPSGRNLSIKIMVAGHESTGLEIRPIEADTAFNVGTCPAPAIRIDRAGSGAVAVVDFGNVPLDELKTYGQAARAETFSVEFVPAEGMAADCRYMAGRVQPSMRFSSAGFYRNGMFEGDPNESAYPGNSVVAVQLSDGMWAVPGANFGEHDPGAYLDFNNSNRRRFTATLKRRPGATDRAGRFLIPVTLEAFYH